MDTLPNFEKVLNDLLVTAYRSIESFEEEMIKQKNSTDLSLSEIHVLEAIGNPHEFPDGKRISEISETLKISLPSVTLAVNKLEKKGYVEKQKSATDGRGVHVKLTKPGIRVERAHRYFHYTMVKAVAKDMTQEEKNALISGIGKLNAFLDKNIEKQREA